MCHWVTTRGDLHAAVAELLAAAGTSCAVEGSVVGVGVVVAIEGYWQLVEEQVSKDRPPPLQIDNVVQRDRDVHV